MKPKQKDIILNIWRKKYALRETTAALASLSPWVIKPTKPTFFAATQLQLILHCSLQSSPEVYILCVWVQMRISELEIFTKFNFMIVCL